MPKIDAFTSKRITKFVEDHRARSGQLPTLRDFEASGFARELIDVAVRDGLLEQLYVTLTNGVVVKGFKVRSSGSL